MNGNYTLPPEFSRAQAGAWVSGVVLLGVCAAGAIWAPTRFFQAYLTSFTFWIGLSLGCLAILMTHYLAGGRWGIPIRRLLEAGSQTLPLMLILFVPLVFGMQRLYVWMQPDAVAADPALQHKHIYLNQPFFLIRAAVYFGSWIMLMWALARAAARQDETPGPAASRRLASLGAGGLVLYFITMSFAAVDWTMSLEPHWYSTIYGFLLFAGQALSGFAFVLLVACVLMKRSKMAEALAPQDLHGLGNFLLTFVIFWAYISFSQFLIIWAGNLAEEVPWYLRRFAGGWKWYAWGLVILHFFVPFFLLLSRDLKRRTAPLTGIAALIFLMAMADVIWQVIPAFAPETFNLHWMDIAALAGMGALWLAVFIRQLKKRPLLPVHDARVEEQYRWT